MSSITAPTTGVAPSHPTMAGEPRRLAAVAALRGLTPPELDGATVVELGCTDGMNLLATAAAHPNLTAVGVDRSTAAIERARAIAEGAALANVSFADGTGAPVEDGSADFVIVAERLSALPAAERGAVIEEAARVAREGGLVALSYDAIPGAIGRKLTRSIGRRAAAAAIEAGDAVAAREAAARALHAAAQNGAGAPDFAALAKAEAERLAQLPPERVLHEELAEHWEPLAVSEIAAAAAGSGLAYLGELLPGDRWRERLPEADVRRVTKLTGTGGAVEQQQLVDDMLGSVAHASLFVRGAAPKEPIGGGARRPAGPPAAEWHVAAEPAGEWPQLPANLAAVGREIQAAGPEGATVAELAARSGATVDAARQAASVLDALGLARLDLVPATAAAAEPGEHPQVSSLVRSQLGLGDAVVASLRHREVRVDDPRLRELLLLLDGTRDRAAIADALAASSTEGAADLVPALDGLLAQFAAAGLLSA